MKITQEKSTIVDYMQTIQVIIDDLDLIGYPLSDEEIIVHTPDGLGDEYKKLTIAIRTQDIPT